MLNVVAEEFNKYLSYVRNLASRIRQITTISGICSLKRSKTLEMSRMVTTTG